MWPAIEPKFTTEPEPRRRYVSDRALRDPKDAGQIEIHHLGPEPLVDFLQLAPPDQRARIVYEHVNATEVFHHVHDELAAFAGA